MPTIAPTDIESIIKNKLPPLPGSIMKVSAMLQDYNISQRKIAEAIGFDPMFASRVLRLANSPIYPFQQSVTNLNDAVSAIGNKAIYEMVLIGMLSDSFGREIRNTVIGRDNWLHSLAVAFGARELCDALRMRGTEEAFSCGLLHDIGSLLFFRADAALYTEISNKSSHNDLSLIEKDVYGFDHSQLGALAAHRWNLSESVCTMILHHHNPAETPEAVFITNIINIADNLAYLKNHKLPIDGEFLSSSAVLNIGFKAEQLESVWEKVVVSLREVIKAFF